MSTPVQVVAFDLESLLEEAFRQLVDDAALFTTEEITTSPVQIASGWDSYEKLTGQLVTIFARASTSEVAGAGYTGNRTITIELSARSHFKDTSGDDHKALVEALFPLVYTVDLPGLLNARATGVQVMAAVPREKTRSTTNDWRISTIGVECYVFGVDPTPPDP